MPKGTAVTKDPANLPDLAPTPSMEFDSSDIVIPQIKLGQPQQDIVQDGLVPAFSVFTRYGAEDDDPIVLVDPAEDGGAPDFSANPDHGLLIHVLSMWKSWSATIDPATGELDKDGEFRTWRWDDPEVHPEADVVYNYLVVLPEHEDGTQTPFRLLLTRTSTPAARTINTTLQRLSGPAYTAAFRFWAQKRENNSGSRKLRWAVAKVRPVQAKPEHVQLASGLVAMAARPQQETAQLERSTDAAPAI